MASEECLMMNRIGGYPCTNWIISFGRPWGGTKVVVSAMSQSVTIHPCEWGGGFCCLQWGVEAACQSLWPGRGSTSCHTLVGSHGTLQQHVEKHRYGWNLIWMVFWLLLDPHEKVAPVVLNALWNRSWKVGSSLWSIVSTKALLCTSLFAEVSC